MVPTRSMACNVNYGLVFAALAALGLSACTNGADSGGDGEVKVPAAKPAQAPEAEKPAAEPAGDTAKPAGETAAQPSAPAVAKEWKQTIVADLAIGGGDGQVGIFPGATEEQPRGPQAFTLMDNGRFFIADNENERLVGLSAEGKFLAAPAVERGKYLTGLTALKGDKLIGFDMNNETLVELNTSGKVLRRLQPDRLMKPYMGLRRLDDNRVLFASMGKNFDLDLKNINKPVLEAAALPQIKRLPVGMRFKMPINLAGVVAKPNNLKAAAFVTTKKLNDGAGEVQVYGGSDDEAAAQSVQLTPPVDGKMGSIVFIDTDDSGRIFVRLEVLTSDNPIHVRRFVQVLDSNLKPAGSFEYPVDDVIIPEKDVEVDAAGNVFVMLPYADKVRILRFAP